MKTIAITSIGLFGLKSLTKKGSGVFEAWFAISAMRRRG